MKIVLFDWGDTLMIDNPNQTGKMRLWDQVQAVSGAKQTLALLSQDYRIVVATNAADSSVEDIKIAFDRVELSDYIEGYLCKNNLGVGKGSSEFFQAILQILSVNATQVIMVGDSLDNDIFPAQQLGIEAIWFNPSEESHSNAVTVKQIKQLPELCRLLYRMA
ncbi:HAD family hydrolase [Vibrio sp. TH_r3]|uniref:HAD family hydrolase n=1 Tax=Vibrio sp. TH_r3 TaxID=3082084 RepID=UPI0029540CBF|nr:HAD family hydrolase [Vibrio sp. TH_r3]MDV7103400.1 HAD family hydrolase [Vibrio sp. TH_r3]